MASACNFPAEGAIKFFFVKWGPGVSCTSRCSAEVKFSGKEKSLTSSRGQHPACGFAFGVAKPPFRLNRDNFEVMDFFSLTHAPFLQAATFL